MKLKDKKDIIQILDSWKDMIGVDSNKVKRLIIEVERIPNEIEAFDTDIESTIHECCRVIGYVNSKENNKSRKVPYPNMRKSVALRVTELFGRSEIVYDYIVKHFNKDRSTIINYVESGSNLYFMGDVRFRRIYEKIKEVDAELQKAA